MIDLRQGDCLEVMKELPSGSIDLVVTDPPYNVSAKNNFHTMGRSGTDFGEWDKGFDQETWLYEVPRLLTKDATVVIFNTFNNLAKTQDILETQGLVYKDFLVMRKSNPMPRNRDRRYINSCEYALVMVVKDSKWVFNRQSETYDSNVIETKVVAGKEKTVHTTQKPLDVIKQLIKRHSNEGQLVLDPFMGSGTTGLACKALNRNFIGIELDETYFNIASTRINNTGESNV